MGLTSSTFTKIRNSKKVYIDEASKNNVSSDTENISTRSEKNMNAMKIVMHNPVVQREYFRFLTRSKGKKACLRLFQTYEELRNQIMTGPHSLQNGVINTADISIPVPEEYTQETEDFEIRFLIRSSIYQLQKLKLTATLPLKIVYNQLIIAEDIILQDLLEDLVEFVLKSPLYQQHANPPRIPVPLDSITEVSGNVSTSTSVHTQHYNSQHCPLHPTVRQEDEEDEETAREVNGEVNNQSLVSSDDISEDAFVAAVSLSMKAILSKPVSIPYSPPQ